MAKWYAIMDGGIEDNDWGTGSGHKRDALNMCKSMNDNCENYGEGRPFYIAVIENDTCIEELDENGDER